MLVGRPAGRSASWPVWTRRTVTSCRAENCGKSAVAVHPQGRLPPLRGDEADSHGLTVHADHGDSPFAVHSVVDVPVAVVVQVPSYLTVTCSWCRLRSA